MLGCGVGEGRFGERYEELLGGSVGKCIGVWGERCRKMLREVC